MENLAVSKVPQLYIHENKYFKKKKKEKEIVF